MKILIDDGSRHTQPTGYGNLSRGIALALQQSQDVELAFRHRSEDVPQWVFDRDALQGIPVNTNQHEFDVVLRIGAPSGGAIKNQIPTAIYTQNALGALPLDWIHNLSGAQCVIVPGEFDAQVFRTHFSNVHCCPQFIDDKRFRPMPRYRDEGPNVPSFFFVGSYSYRKGVDALLQTFSKAFAPDEKVNLTMHCFSGLERTGANDLLSRARELPNNVNLRIFNGNSSPEWMARFYNQHDATITFSRGEGWCMPLHEGLLSGKPTIAPNSTAMGEMLPMDGVRRVAVEAAKISDIQSPFGGSMRRAYGIEGNIMWNVVQDDAIAAVRDVYENLETYAEAAKSGRQFILENYSRETVSAKLLTALQSIL